MNKENLDKITLTLKEFNDEIEVLVTCPKTNQNIEISPRYPLKLLVPDKKEELIALIKSNKDYTLGRCPHCQQEHTWAPKSVVENHEKYPSFK
jgi:hypothetical protein